MNVGSLPLNSAPAMKWLKAYTESGTFGSDQVTLSFPSTAMDADQLKAVGLLLEAGIKRSLDGTSEDLNPAPGHVLTRDGMELRFQESSKLSYCIRNAESTTFFAFQGNDQGERLAFAVQSNLEMGGPPTQFYGITNTFETGQSSAERLS